jgi:Holliday junction resolvase
MPKINIKDKGNRWERESVKILNQRFPGTWKRIPGSGAIGTLVKEPMLAADIVGNYSFLNKPVMGECKTGYGGKSMTIQKDWFDHAVKVAQGVHGIPAVVLKFERSVKGVKHVVALDFDTWDYLMGLLESQNELIESLQYELSDLYE